MLEARDVTFRYGKGRPVIEGLSITVRPDERVAIVAPSGAGKTTLCRLLAGYEQPTSGSVLADGEPLPRAGACPVQLVGQHPEHSFDPRLTLRASLREAGAAGSGLLERFGVQQRWLARYPRELSGGELQRLNLVRALTAAPRYLVVDEMTAMLDAITQVQIWRELMAEAESRAMGIVLTSHSPALTERVATRVVQLASERSA